MPTRSGKNFKKREPIAPFKTTIRKRTKGHNTAHDLELFGFKIPYFIRSSTTLLFITLAVCHVAAAFTFAFLQEKVTQMDGFRKDKYPPIMTCIETLTFSVCAFLELTLSGGKQGRISSPRAPILNYVLLSMFTFGGMYCTNSGLKFISYPTRIIFKGAKPVPTMIIEYLYVGKIFAPTEILSVCILVVGIIVFSSADAWSKSSSSNDNSLMVYGYAFMIGGVICDSFTSNFEKKNIFAKYKATHCEAMFFASVFGFIWSVVTLMSTDSETFMEALTYFASTPTAVGWLFLSSLGAYMSIVFVLLLISVYSTTYAECVKGVRKVCSIMASIFLLGKDKSFGALHMCGIGCFVLSSTVTIYNKSIKGKKSKTSKASKKKRN